MSNPDAYSALVSGTEINAHFASMPYIDREAKDGYRSILSGKDAFGDASIVCVTTKSFHEKPVLYAALIQALSDAVQLINDRDPEALEIISKVENIDTGTAEKYLSWSGTNYSTAVYGAMSLAGYMADFGYISKAPQSGSDIMWSSASAVIGQRQGEPSAVEKVQ